ncbi:MAG: ABC transporter ATP-binding protein [Erysipelotrichaceae bacterium]|nr:ABC transporter ATP-binding protein [Erysipelotrichaceae bacterium]
MKEIFQTFKRLKWFFKKNILSYLCCALALLFVSVMPVIPTKVLGIAIDDIVMGNVNSTRIFFYVIGIFIIPIFIYFVNIYYHYTMNKLGQNLSFLLREKYLAHLFELDSSVYEKYTKGDLIARITNDLTAVSGLATSFLQNVIFYAVTIVAAISVMLSINPVLCICAVAFMPFAIFLLNNARKKKREYYKKHHEIYGEMTESVLESIESVKTVRAYGMEEEDYCKTKKAIDNDTNSWWYIQMFESLFVPMFELVYAVSYFIAIGLGSYMVIKSIISPGDLVSFLLYVGMLYGPLIGLSNVLNTISSINIASVRFFEIMDQKTSVEDIENPKHILKFNQIEFKNVSFKYPFDNFHVLKKINFSIKSGETIGIVGPTGSGKSTLIRQLLREFNVTEGEILIDNESIEKYSIDDIRKLVGYVPQEHILFRRSVDDNILIGNPQATHEQIDSAMVVADFKKDLKELSAGEHTLVSELGGSLSGGQRQRLSIARALVKDPEILILDDSLSAVDALTETNIIKQLKETRVGKTNIIVAHCFSSIALADKIIVLQDGQITDIGTHKELLKYDNWYKMQYLIQIKGDNHEEL